MKVGDRLYCYRNINGLDNISNMYSVGIFYSIVHIKGERIYLISNTAQGDWFYRLVQHEWNYSNWFYTLKELRKVKLDLLKSVGTNESIM